METRITEHADGWEIVHNGRVFAVCDDDKCYIISAVVSEGSIERLLPVGTCQNLEDAKTVVELLDSPE